MGKGQRTQKHRMDDAEDGRGRADAEREGQNRYQGEAGRSGERAGGVAQVLIGLLDPRPAPDGPRVFTDPGHVAERAPRRLSRLRRRGTVGDPLFGVELEVRANLARQVVVAVVVAAHAGRSGLTRASACAPSRAPLVAIVTPLR